jgi:hypothetical protein
LSEILWSPDQYSGEASVAVTATQLDDRIVPSASGRRRILSAWIEFFSTHKTAIKELHLRSRVPQELLDSLIGQPQLATVHLKWGPYRDISVLSSLPLLSKLTLGGATALGSLEPLRDRASLVDLSVAQGHRITDLSPISSLLNLVDLRFAGYIGSDKLVRLEDLCWVEPLATLRSLDLGGARLVNPDLSPLLRLPRLEELRLPLRRQYRAQVFELASTSPAFAELAAEYTAYDAYVSLTRPTPPRG